MSPIPKILSLLIATTIWSCAADKSAISSLGSLDNLPDGTSLEGVRIPRYSKDLKPVAYIEADEITKTSALALSIKKLSLYQYNPDGSERLHLALTSAVYNTKSKIVKGFTPLKVSSEDMVTHASGIALNIDSQRGLLLGPLHTSYQFPKKSSSMTPPSKSLKSKAVAGVAIASIAIAPAEGLPPTLSQEKLVELDAHLNASQQQSFDQQMKESREHVQAVDATRSKEAIAFINQHAAEKAQQILGEAPLAKTSVAKTSSEKDQLNISCDGGMFYDAPKGLLSYMTNVKVVEPRLSITCKKDLKVYLATKEEKKIAKNKQGVKKIVAVGDVKINGKMTEKGITRMIEGTANIVEFDYITGITIFRGGFPSIKIMENGRSFVHKSISKDQWILVKKDGSVRIEGGVNQNLKGLSTLQDKKDKAPAPAPVQP